MTSPKIRLNRPEISSLTNKLKTPCKAAVVREERTLQQPLFKDLSNSSYNKQKIHCRTPGKKRLHTLMRKRYQFFDFTRLFAEVRYKRQVPSAT